MDKNSKTDKRPIEDYLRGVKITDLTPELESQEDQGEKRTFPQGDTEAKKTWWPSCIHRWVKADKTISKGQITFLMRCRRCNQFKSESFTRDITNRSVYTHRTVHKLDPEQHKE